jgi:hypothetical protein
VDVGGEERLVVVQELKRTQRKADVEEVAGAIRRAVNEGHELQVYAVVLVRPMSVPKTSSGKIQRHVCRAAFLENSLKVIGRSVLDTPPTATAIGQQEKESFIHKALLAVDDAAARHSLLAVYLQEQAARILRLPVPQVDPRQSLGALGLDALGAVELKDEVQTSLGVILPRVDALQEHSISQLVPQIAGALGAPSENPAAVAKTTPAR